MLIEKDCIDSLASKQQLTKNPSSFLLLKSISNKKIEDAYIR